MGDEGQVWCVKGDEVQVRALRQVSSGVGALWEGGLGGQCLGLKIIIQLSERRMTFTMSLCGNSSSVSNSSAVLPL